VVGALRAFGAREPDPAVRNPDTLAEKLIGPDELRLIETHPIAKALQGDYAKGRQNQEVAGMSNLLLIRTRFIDEHLKRTIAAGVRQVVILGAGLDTRAYRFSELLEDATVFEIDYRSTQEVKRRRLVAASIPIPPQLRFAEIDFKKDALQDVLHNAGYDALQRSFFIWEGVSMYLSEAAARDTLRAISSYAAPGSLVAMDFAETSMIDLLRKFPNLAQHNYTTRWCEPWIFGVPDMREPEFFRQCGFEVRELLSILGSEAAERYLKRCDGSKFGNVRGGPPRKRRLVTALRVLWMFMTRRSRWYGLALLEKTAILRP